MKRFLSLALMAALVLGLSSVVYANVCAFDPVPAATILFPFVAYDYSGNTGTTTLFNITNVSSEATIVHFTLWTDYSLPVLDWNVLLTGYDVQRQNIRDILRDGQLPVTYTEGHGVIHNFTGSPLPNWPDPSPNEGVQDRGPVSEAGHWLGNVPTYDYVGDLMDGPEATSPALAERCPATSDNNPANYMTPIPGYILDYFEAVLTASQVRPRTHTLNCDYPSEAYDADDYPLEGVNLDPWWSSRDTSGPTWMYITADVVQTCNKMFPDTFDAYYFDELRYENVIMGDMQWVDDVNRFSESSQAVHLEADLNIHDVVTTNLWSDRDEGVTFYSRYVNNLSTGTPSDFREPLGTAWAFRYMGPGRDDLDTKIRVWKGSTALRNIADLHFADETEVPRHVVTHFVASDCWAYTYYAWDDNENIVTAQGGSQNPWSGYEEFSIGDPNLLPMETQEVSVDQFVTVDEWGWMLFVWPPSNTDTDPIDKIYGDYDGLGRPRPDAYQTWMGVKYEAFNAFSSFHNGTLMGNWNCFSDQVLPNLGIDYGYIYDADFSVTEDAWGREDPTTIVDGPIVGEYVGSPCTAYDYFMGVCLW